jgi:lipopolysaccharide transport system ATP-binding protein
MPLPMSSEAAMISKTTTVIKCSDLGKCYRIYDDPKARLKQALWRGRRQYYREFWALRNISFEVKRGESLGIIGRNGSGKSTLLQLICGTLTPTEGTLQTQGRIAALLELGSGFNPEFTGLENVYLNASMLGLSKKQTDAALEDIVAFADIGEFVNQPVKTYSSGMAVRLAFAVIAHVNADILVVDEALAVGDAVFVQRCMRFIRKMREERCLLFVSHDAEAVKSLCSHALWISNGEAQALGGCKPVCLSYHRYCMAQSYGDAVKIEAIGQEQANVDLHKNSLQPTSSPSPPCSQHELLDYDCKASAIDNLSNADGWKTGDAELVSVTIKSASSNSDLSPLKGGEEVEIEILARINKYMEKPAIGFTLTNRLGQHLLGENTLICRDSGKCLAAHTGDMLSAHFKLIFPMLPSGKYMLMASIADGDLNDHIQHHWTENAVLIEVVSSRVRYGLVGCFLLDAKLQKEQI